MGTVNAANRANQTTGPATPFKGEMQRPKNITLNLACLAGIPGSARIHRVNNTVGLNLQNGMYGQIDMGRSKIGAWPVKVTFGTADFGPSGGTVPVQIMYTDGQIANRCLRVSCSGGVSEVAAASPSAVANHWLSRWFF